MRSISNRKTRDKSIFHPQLVQYIYPDLYRVDELSDIGGIEDPADKEIVIPQPPRLQVRRMMIEDFD